VVTDRLARRYRRLLRAYPAGPRRHELLDTLLDCAGPDRRRPTAREAANLLRHGLRARLGRPGTTAVVVFATLIAIATGFVGAAAANRLAWSAAPALPTGAAADRLTGVAFPGLRVWGGGDAATFMPEPDGENIRYGYADYWVRHTPQTRDVAAYSAGVRDRLAAAGWHIGAEPAPDPLAAAPDDPRNRMFWATRDHLRLEYSAAYWPDHPRYASDGFVEFRLSRTESPLTAGAAVAGGLLSALAGWLLTGWVSRRTERWPGVGGLLGVVAAVALVLLLPALLLTLNAVVGDPAVTPFWNGLVHLGRGPALVAGLIAPAVLAAVGAGPAWRRAAAAVRPLRRPGAGAAQRVPGPE
jgi:hypothetical protein